MVITHPCVLNLELEINERLQIGRDELVEHKDRHHHDEPDEPDGQHCKIDSIPTFPTVGQPMDDHTDDKEREHGPIVEQDIGDGRHIPVSANAVHHRLGGVPCRLVGYRRIQIGTRTEEQARERDEHEGHQYIPAEIQPVNIPVRPDGRIDATNQGAAEKDSRPYGEDHQHRFRPEVVAHEERGEDQAGDKTPEPLGEMPPNLEPQDAEAVQTTPYHEVPRRAVPQTTQQHGVHHVDVGTDFQTRLFADEGDDGEYDRQPDNDARDNGVLGEQDDNRANHQDAQIGANGGVAVAA